jgi:hypothetical protein
MLIRYLVCSSTRSTIRDAIHSPSQHVAQCRNAAASTSHLARVPLNAAAPALVTLATPRRAPKSLCCALPASLHLHGVQCQNSPACCCWTQFSSSMRVHLRGSRRAITSAMGLRSPRPSAWRQRSHFPVRRPCAHNSMHRRTWPTRALLCCIPEAVAQQSRVSGLPRVKRWQAAASCSAATTSFTRAC